MKQVVGKRRNKSDTYILCPVESHGWVDGLYTIYLLFLVWIGFLLLEVNTVSEMVKQEE